MKALLFPGQGSQIVGMGSEFFNNFDIVKKIFNEADEALKFKLSKIILNGPDDELKLTQNTQPAIMTVSYSIFSVLKKEYNITLDQFKYFAGHSLGEYSALVSGEALNFSDAVYLLQERGKAMQEAVPVGQGAMLAVLGCEIEELNNFITNLKSKKVCEIANDNSVGQTIVSGGVESISELQNELKVNKNNEDIKIIKALEMIYKNYKLTKHYELVEKIHIKMSIDFLKDTCVQVSVNEVSENNASKCIN